MNTQLRTTIALVVALAALPLTLTACSAPAPAAAPTAKPAETAAPIEEVKPDAGDATVAAGFTTILDTSGVVSVSAPSAWTDVDGTPIAGPNGTTLLNVAASPNLYDFTHSFNVPGVAVTATNDPTLTPEFFVDSLLTSTGSQCEDGETGDYDDSVYVGTYLYFPNCGGTTTDFVAIVAKDSLGTLVIVNIQMVTDEEKSTIRNEILGSFYAIF